MLVNVGRLRVPAFPPLKPPVAWYACCKSAGRVENGCACAITGVLTAAAETASSTAVPLSGVNVTVGCEILPWSHPVGVWESLTFIYRRVPEGKAWRRAHLSSAKRTQSNVVLDTRDAFPTFVSRGNSLPFSSYSIALIGTS